ncbi:TPA: alpha/beta hydrolase [Candidatus Poribacteria bacterium]|nr:alpha/beta hydrolase [Candidatus Poribacteria bacterium]
MNEVNRNKSIVYMGYTATDLAIQLDVAKTIKDLPAYQQESAEMSHKVVTNLDCFKDVQYGNDEPQKLDIFPAAVDRAPILVDIHGGGWRSGSRNIRSFPASSVTKAGVMWVPIDYGLAPNYSIHQMVDHVRSAIVWLYHNVSKYGGDPSKLYVSGNSAGGHLTGCILMPDWHKNYGVPSDIIKGACAISGVYDLQALVHAEYGYNDELGMDIETAQNFSPLFNLPTKGCPLIVSYGAPEPNEFRRQSRVYYEAWKDGGFPATEIVVNGAHHFAMSRQMSDPNSALFQAVTKMIYQ